MKIKQFYHRLAKKHKQTVRRAQIHARKDAYVKHRGGVCEVCDKVLTRGIAEFHHPNPAAKDKKSKQLFYGSITKNLDELETLELVCPQCHREIHEEWAKKEHEINNDLDVEKAYKAAYDHQHREVEKLLKWYSEQRSPKTSSETSTPSPKNKRGTRKPKTSSQMSQQTLWDEKTQMS